MAARVALPIDPHLPEIAAALGRGNLVLIAPPGAGKTTRVPPALFAQAGAGEIVVLEPRRIAARMAARRVASELGERCGDRVGYEVRFEREVSAATRLRFVTEALLVRRLATDPELREVSVVLIDEFHERHLAGDLALALLRRLQATRRPDLRLAAMSATMDPAPAAAFLDAAIVRTEGRAHPVALEYLEAPPRDHLDKEVARAVRRLVSEGLDGDVLVFLPGAAEIGRAREACAEIATRADLAIMPLHGSLPAAEQDAVLAPSTRKKLILATNVAETSLTIDGVVAVIDSGLARIARHSPWSGVATLQVEPVSRNSAAQRAGRAGRTRPGRCLRLYTRHDHDGRREHDPPEILRSDLAETALLLAASGAAITDVAWLTPPPAAAIEAATALLARLGATDGRGLTELGRRMVRLPVHPRLGRVLVEAEARGVARDACLAVAVLGEREVRLARRGPARGPEIASDSDLFDDVDALRAAAGGRGDARALRGYGLEPAAAAGALRAARQLERLIDGSRRPAGDPDEALALAVLAGHPDRVARRRRKGAPELILCDGSGAVLGPDSAVQAAELVLVLDADERGRGKERKVTVRRASAIDGAWLIELFADRLVEADLHLVGAGDRVERVRRMSYDALTLAESRDADPAKLDPEAAARCLAAAVRERGVDAFVDREALAALRARLGFAATACPERGLRSLDDAELERLLARAAIGAFTLAELRGHDLVAGFLAGDPALRRELDRIAPETVSLPGRKRVAVHYDGERPWIASRMQDFFGLATGPTVAEGRVPLVLHLLAPNQRAVQVTTDLASFWKNHYPALRRELMRRYPRHAWPEAPG